MKDNELHLTNTTVFMLFLAFMVVYRRPMLVAAMRGIGRPIVGGKQEQAAEAA